MLGLVQRLVVAIAATIALPASAQSSEEATATVKGYRLCVEVLASALATSTCEAPQDIATTALTRCVSMKVEMVEALSSASFTVGDRSFDTSDEVIRTTVVRELDRAFRDSAISTVVEKRAEAGNCAAN